MSRLMRWVCIAVALAITSQVAYAAPVPAEAKVETSIDKARAALGQKINIKVEQKSFHDAIEVFKNQTKMDITLDVNALQMAGMSAEQPIVNFDAKDITVREAMKKAFGKFNLVCGITKNGFVISSEDGVINRQMRQRVSVAVEDKSLPSYTKALAQETGVNVVLDPRIAKLAESAKVTMNLDDVPVETALRLGVELAGFRTVRMNNVLLITTEERADKLKNEVDRPAPATPINPFFPDFDGGFGPGGFPVPGIGAPGGIERAIPAVEAVPDLLPPPPPAPAPNPAPPIEK